MVQTGHYCSHVGWAPLELCCTQVTPHQRASSAWNQAHECRHDCRPQWSRIALQRRLVAAYQVPVEPPTGAAGAAVPPDPVKGIYELNSDIMVRSLIPDTTNNSRKWSVPYTFLYYIIHQVLAQFTSKLQCVCGCVLDSEMKWYDMCGMNAKRLVQQSPHIQIFDTLSNCNSGQNLQGHTMWQETFAVPAWHNLR